MNISITPNTTLEETQNIEAVADVLSKAFKGVPGDDYFVHKFNNIPLTVPLDEAKVKELRLGTVSFFKGQGAEIIQANNFDAVAIWQTPDVTITAGEVSDQGFNEKYIQMVKRAVRKVIPDEMKRYYLFMIGRDPNGVTKGSVRSIFEYYKNRADIENSAIYLESISEAAKSVYEYFGFKNYLTFQVGVGEVNSLGKQDPQGKGFTMYLMVYHKDADSVLNSLP
ncbi:hypothetical protein KAFR_0D01350 [Kazachstania africana CBS 2517]|uniref:N-acetyltransferase domain-containing protein n=1 Tax=Kazachstania africana (strain ATCC 22294 / BCRC 22015 / CBS 2517 / CECT 1963 / NBRC 1671 / NRRL Y-8276) TaxID=1071382 RepID=H2ATT1_KAZAF|nr:hypothetical protein KAFR_0D01350 [Kazachstania africana CBS 2517]CCF57781.1 hypothetical protein KAFR_0D01350 [Kazachstania africana CBS 2517]